MLMKIFRKAQQERNPLLRLLGLNNPLARVDSVRIKTTNRLNCCCNSRITSLYVLILGIKIEVIHVEKELLFEGKENASSVNIKEFSPRGAILDITLAGKINGKASVFIMSTHNILMKPGGTSEVDLKSIIFSNGEPIFAWGKATGKVIELTPLGKIE